MFFKTYLSPLLQVFPLSPSVFCPFPLTFEISSIFSWVQFVLPTYYWEWDLLWCVINLLGVTSLKKTESPSLNSYQILNNSQLLMGFNAHLTTYVLEFVWLELV